MNGLAVKIDLPFAPSARHLIGTKPDVDARFWGNVRSNPSTECWEWTGGKSVGYGRFRMNGKRHYVHRLSYEWSIGLIPGHLQIDHLCRVRHCVNPKHMELVSAQENKARGQSAEQWQRKTHCKRGHALTLDNVYGPRRGRGRVCRRCCIDYSLSRLRATAQ